MNEKFEIGDFVKINDAHSKLWPQRYRKMIIEIVGFNDTVKNIIKLKEVNNVKLADALLRFSSFDYHLEKINPVCKKNHNHPLTSIFK